MKYRVSGYVCNLGERVSLETETDSEDKAIEQFNDTFKGDLESVYAERV